MANAQVFLPKLSDDEFRTYLFYVLECPGVEDFIGSFSRGKSTLIQLATRTWQSIFRSHCCGHRLTHLRIRRSRLGAVLRNSVCGSCHLSAIAVESPSSRECGRNLKVAPQEHSVRSAKLLMTPAIACFARCCWASSELATNDCATESLRCLTSEMRLPMARESACRRMRPARSRGHRTLFDVLKIRCDQLEYFAAQCQPVRAISIRQLYVEHLASHSGASSG